MRQDETNCNGLQRWLPIESIDKRDESYLLAIEALPLADRCHVFASWICRTGSLVSIGDDRCVVVDKRPYRSINIGISRASISRAVVDMKAGGLLIESHDGRWILNLTRCLLVQEAQELSREDDQFDSNWIPELVSGVSSVSCVSAPGDPVKGAISNPRVGVPCTSAPHPEILRPMPVRPWAKDGGITDEHLTAAVRYRDIAFIRHLYDQLIEARWVEDSPDARQRFLSLVHHCATHQALRRRVGTLQAKIRNKLDCKTVTARSDNWGGLWLHPFENPLDPEVRGLTIDREKKMSKVL